MRAIVLGLAPLLHARFAGWGLDLPPRVAAKLKVTYERQAKRNASIYQQLHEVLTACAKHGLHPIALKGVHLAAVFYPDPALRPMNDIDLLFAPGELPAAESVLLELGYGGKYKHPDFGPGITKHTSTFLRPGASGGTPNPYLSALPNPLVEPHTSLEESWFGLKVDITPGVRERAVVVDLGGQDCLALQIEDLLLHLCVHFCFHLIMGRPALVQLVDLLQVTMSGKVDWSAFAERAAVTVSSAYALAGLTLAQRFLGAEVPAEVLSVLSASTPKHLRRRIHNMKLQAVLARTQQRPVSTFRDRLHRGFTDRLETARWASDWRAKWRVWQTAFRVSRTDTGRMLLRKLRMRA